MTDQTYSSRSTAVTAVRCRKDDGPNPAFIRRRWDY